ncbi:MAG: hypothetical protein AAF636_16180 [Pseudomonadota bacterium]
MSSMTFNDLKPILRRSAKIALIVGPILTLINQWEVVSVFQDPDLAKMSLTFLVPFFVSSFSGYAMRKSLVEQMRSTQTRIDQLHAEAKRCAARAEKAEAALADFSRGVQTEDAPGVQV